MKPFNPKEYVAANLTEERVKELKYIFDILDMDKTGYISSKEFSAAFKSYELDKKNPELYRLIDNIYLVYKNKQIGKQRKGFNELF